MNYLAALALLANAVVNRTFVPSDYGIERFSVQVVSPAPITDTATPVLMVSVATTPDTGCVNPRLILDTDRQCAIAIYCDRDGIEGQAALTITGDCD